MADESTNEEPYKADLDEDATGAGLEDGGGADPAAGSRMPTTFLDSRTTLVPAEMDKRKIVYPGMSNQRVARSYRELRTKLVGESDLAQRTVLVAPIIAGKSGPDVAVNLSAAFAFDERRAALLVDCDFHNDSVSEKLGLEPGLGLLDFLSDRDVTSDEIVRPSGMRRFRVVTTGRKRTLTEEHVTSPRLRLFLDEMRQRVSEWFIIINAPPILESADAPVLADMCDLIVLVVPYGRVTNSTVSQAVDSIGRNRISGVVFTQ